MIASLPMYDRAETAEANDAFWTSIRAALGVGPERLKRDGDLWDHWFSPDLLLSQTCGLPFRSRLHDRVTLIATPDYGLPGCPPGHYNSVFVARKDDRRNTLAAFAQARFAYNSRDSQSGYASALNHGFAFASDLKTGAHVASARAVAEGTADIACIDAQTWRMCLRWDDFAAELKELERTAPTPGLPFITARKDPAPLRAAIEVALGQGLGAPLDIRLLADLPVSAYRAVPTPSLAGHGPD